MFRVLRMLTAGESHGPALTAILDGLPAGDERSRSVVRRMRDEEAEHGDHARAAGAAELPPPIRRLMRLTARVMTRSAYWV